MYNLASMHKPTRREIASAVIATLDHRKHPQMNYGEYRRQAFQALEAFLGPRKASNA